jgi:hypothetical protein
MTTAWVVLLLHHQLKRNRSREYFSIQRNYLRPELYNRNPAQRRSMITSELPTNRLESFDERRKAGSTNADCSFSGGVLRILQEPGHKRDASGHQRHASDVTEQFPPHQDLLGHHEERNHDDPEQIHDACHEE